MYACAHMHAYVPGIKNITTILACHNYAVYYRSYSENFLVQNNTCITFH